MSDKGTYVPGQEPTACVVCGDAIQQVEGHTGRPRLYCSGTCRNRKHRARRPAPDRQPIRDSLDDVHNQLAINRAHLTMLLWWTKRKAQQEAASRPAPCPHRWQRVQEDVERCRTCLEVRSLLPEALGAATARKGRYLPSEESTDG